MNINDSIQDIIKHYQTKGWVVVDGVFEKNKVEQIVKITDGIIEKEVAEGALHSFDKNSEGRIAPRKVNEPFLKDEMYKKFLSCKNLQKLLSAFLQEDACLVSDQIFLKPPLVGSEKPYHQDNEYFKCTPADKLITAWIALDDVDVENGCMRYIDGTNKSKIVPHVQDSVNKYNLVIPPEYLDLKKESLAEVKKGGVVFHHGNTMHKSGVNTSNRWRRGYATHWAIPTIHTESEQVKNGYFYSFNKEMSLSV
jgi:phytanoyl-CoA hydroxylase